MIKLLTKTPETVLDCLCRQPTVDDRLHDPEDAQTDARQLHQGEGEETLQCDHDMLSLVDKGLVGIIKSRCGSFGSHILPTLDHWAIINDGDSMVPY